MPPTICEERRSSPLPEWLRRPMAFHGQWNDVGNRVRGFGLHTVCEEARCPNLGECWSHGNVSFMILGDRCTRRCAFCAVTTARPGAVDLEEPKRLAQAVAQLSLRHVVVTSVARDDLEDEGSVLFAQCIREIRALSPSTSIEVLTPDFHAREKHIQVVVEAKPAVFAHNLETVLRLTPAVRPQANYQRSLETLRLAKALGDRRLKTKSGLMVGLGEDHDEVRETLVDLRRVDCDFLTIGQYLRPTPHHRLVDHFVEPVWFDRYHRWALELGFRFVASAPYVRSSYNAFEALKEGERDENKCR